MFSHKKAFDPKDLQVPFGDKLPVIPWYVLDKEAKARAHLQNNLNMLLVMESAVGNSKDPGIVSAIKALSKPSAYPLFTLVKQSIRAKVDIHLAALKSCNWNNHEFKLLLASSPFLPKLSEPSVI